MHNWPNRITMARMLLVPAFVILVLNIYRASFLRYLALGLFAMMAAADAADGALARRLHQATRLGALLDPIADKLLLSTAFILLGLQAVVSGWLKWPIPDWLVVAVISRDLFILLGCAVVYFWSGMLKIAPTRLGKQTTAAQMLLVMVTFITPDLPTQVAEAVSGGLWVVVAALTIGSWLGYIRVAIRRLGEAPVPSGLTSGAEETTGQDRL